MAAQNRHLEITADSLHSISSEQLEKLLLIKDFNDLTAHQIALQTKPLVREDETDFQG